MWEHVWRGRGSGNYAECVCYSGGRPACCVLTQPAESPGHVSSDWWVRSLQCFGRPGGRWLTPDTSNHLSFLLEDKNKMNASASYVIHERRSLWAVVTQKVHLIWFRLVLGTFRDETKCQFPFKQAAVAIWDALWRLIKACWVRLCSSFLCRCVDAFHTRQTSSKLPHAQSQSSHSESEMRRNVNCSFCMAIYDSVWLKLHVE